jgi:hypothetical protein
MTTANLSLAAPPMPINRVSSALCMTAREPMHSRQPRRGPETVPLNQMVQDLDLLIAGQDVHGKRLSVLGGPR